MKDLSIRDKLLLVILGTTIVALLLGFAVMIWYNVRTFRREMVADALVRAQVVGGYTLSELAFGDAAEATRTLGKLRSIPDLERASLYDREGKLFAAFSRSPGEPEQLPFDSAGFAFDGDILHVVQPIVSENERYGTLHLCTSTRALTATTQRYLTVVLALSAGLIGLAVVAAVRLQGVISKPVLRLAEAARRVSQDGDFSARVAKQGDDEVGALCNAWNEMLGQIQQRQEEQALAEAALRRSEERFRGIIERSNDAIYVLRGEGQFSYVNPKFEELLEVTLEEATAPDFDNLRIVTPESRELIRDQRARRSRGEQTESRYEFKCVSRSGRVFDFEVNTTDIEWGNEPVRMGIMRDITARKMAERRLQEQQHQLGEHARQVERYALVLERSNRELDQFAYVVSHDLRAPLRAISNLSSWIESDLGNGLTPEIREQMDLLRRRVRRMESLINGILEYSRIGRVRAIVEEVAVADLIAEVVEDLAPPPGFSIRTVGEMPVLHTDKVRLAQVFANLIGNAVKHHPRSSGRVEISARDIEDAVEFAVRDDGAGIAPEHHERIFAIFETLKSRDELESTGVGLAIVKRIVEDRGGVLAVESDVGEGATFYFSWPKAVPGDSGAESPGRRE